MAIFDYSKPAVYRFVDAEPVHAADPCLDLCESHLRTWLKATEMTAPAAAQMPIAEVIYWVAEANPGVSIDWRPEITCDACAWRASD